MVTESSLMNRIARYVFTLTTALLVTVVGSPAQESEILSRSAIDGLALTPPMGWYPWNQFGQEPQNEKLIKEIADAVVSSGMRDAGYMYVGPDEGICFKRGADGLLTTVLSRYPSGLRGLGDYIHQQGLKYALYTDAGNLTCSKAMPGTRDHEFEDMRAFADWRCDYLKIDWCNAARMNVVKAYTLLHEAQLAAGRPLVHSLCTWGMAIHGNGRLTSAICGGPLATSANPAKRTGVYLESMRGPIRSCMPAPARAIGTTPT